MIMGMGDTTTAATQTAPPSAMQSFTTGLQQWESPTQALATAGTLVSNPSAALAGSALPYTLGVLAVPIALILLVANMGGK
jgi:hypothetical protein